MKTCAVLIPTRKRPERLERTIESVFNTAEDPTTVEVCLRVDLDDVDTISRLLKLCHFYKNLRVLIADRESGYASLHDYYTQLSHITDARWVMILNDDITLEGCGWDTALRDVSLNRLVWAENLINGGSWYNSYGCAFVCPIVVNRSWELFGHQGFGAVVDEWCKAVYAKAGWQVHILGGLTINHQRDDTNTLTVHRKL